MKNLRFFTHDTGYDAVDWNDQNAAIQKFKEQLEGWYIRPIESLIAQSRHFGFTAIALTCILIDTLAQYYEGAERSREQFFKEFLKRYSPEFGKPFPTPIEYWFKGTKRQVENFADAVYVAFRCGILHEAHVALYGVVHDDAHAIEYREKGITLYENGNDCPTVVISPKKFFYEMKIAFEDYFQKLGDSDTKWDHLRNNFKKKFLVSYGIEIGNEP